MRLVPLWVAALAAWSVTGCAGASCDHLVPFKKTTATMRALHFETSGCVRATYNPTFLDVDRRQDAQAALDAWDLEGLPLCFEALVDDTTAPSGAEARVHFQGGNPGGGFPGVNNSRYDEQTGVISSSTITLDLAPFLSGTPRITAAELIRLLGFGVGLDTPAAGVDSIMIKPVVPTSPTENDRKALQVLYGGSCTPS